MTMKTKIFLLFLSIPFCFFSQTKNSLDLKTISGFITHKNKSISNVNVFVENSTRYSVSDSTGFYSVKAKIGEIISFNYVGLKSKNIIIEDVTNVININLKEDLNILQISPKKAAKLGESTIGDHSSNFRFIEIKGKDLNKYSPTLTSAILEIVPELSAKINDYGEEIIYVRGSELNGPGIWIIDEVTYDLPIPVFIDEVVKISIMNYDSKGFIINVQTNIDYKKITGIDYHNYYFNEDDYYNYDAISYKKIKTKNPEFINKYNKIRKEKDALNLYEKTYQNDKDLRNYHYTMLRYFESKKFSKNIVLQVLSDFENYAEKNPEDLKAIAYKYQEVKEYSKAIAIYKKIVKLRPAYKQSYRDLTNALLDLKEFRNLWVNYKYFLNKGFKIKESDIDEIIASEMISAYNADSSNLHQKVKMIKASKNIESDVRLVIEWNTIEAEFVLEFINPELQVYAIENSSDKNEALIFDQKKEGYSSKEIFIDKLKYGYWYVNLEYLGNKHYKPTVIKITTYYNWGRQNQKKEVNVFNLSKINTKANLLKLNRRFF